MSVQFANPTSNIYEIKSIYLSHNEISPVICTYERSKVVIQSKEQWIIHSVRTSQDGKSMKY